MIKSIQKRGIAFKVNASNPSLVSRLVQSTQAFGTTFRNFSFWNRVARNAYEPHIFEVFDRFLDKEHSFIDIGSWIGPMVLYGCQRARKCYAVEPDPVAFAILTSNVALNPELQERIVLFNGAIWNQTGTMRFGTSSTFGDSMSSGHFTDSFNTLAVPSMTFEDFVARHRIADLGFIKMDIEAGETVVLPTMKEFIAERAPTMFISLHPLWFPDLESDTRRILEVLSPYRAIFSITGKPLSPEYIARRLKTRLILDILATNLPWKA